MRYKLRWNTIGALVSERISFLFYVIDRVSCGFLPDLGNKSGGGKEKTMRERQREEEEAKEGSKTKQRGFCHNVVQILVKWRFLSSLSSLPRSFWDVGTVLYSSSCSCGFPCQRSKGKD